MFSKTTNVTRDKFYCKIILDVQPFIVSFHLVSIPFDSQSITPSHPLVFRLLATRVVRKNARNRIRGREKRGGEGRKGGCERWGGRRSIRGEREEWKGGESFRGTVQSLANNARGFRQLARSKWPRDLPAGDENLGMQHAFGFMEVSGRKTDFREGGGGRGIK